MTKTNVTHDPEFVELAEDLSNTGEADGNTSTEESNESTLQSDDETTEALAEVVEEAESNVDLLLVPEGEVSLTTVQLEFASGDTIEAIVDTEFQLALREVCNAQGERPVSFEVTGDTSPEALRLLMNVIK